MDGAEKVKLALDELRMLALGAQVLLGFQLSSVFQQRFDALSAHARTLDALSLILMVMVLGLLIAPAIRLRVVDDGNASTRAVRHMGTMMSLALLPFAISLGMNVFVALERIAGIGRASLGAIAAIALALWFWFGLEWSAVARKDGKPMTRVEEKIALAKKIDQMLTEARVVLPGAQALLGFQLSVVLTEAFERLPPSSQASHGIALAFVALATVLLMAPAAYHRIVYAGEASE